MCAALRLSGLDPDAGRGAVAERLGGRRSGDVRSRAPAPGRASRCREACREVRQEQISQMKRSLLLGLLSLRGRASISTALDRDAFTITSYRLNVQVDRASHVFAVTYGRLVLRNDSKVPQKNASLQISSSLEWNDIGTDDDPRDCNCFAQPKRKLQWLGETYTSDIDHTGALSEAIVTLEKPVPPGGSVAIDVQYGGKITADSTRLTRMGVPQELALHSDWDQISEAIHRGARPRLRGLVSRLYRSREHERRQRRFGRNRALERAPSQQRLLRLPGGHGSRPILRIPASLRMIANARGIWTVGGGASDPNAPPLATPAQDAQADCAASRLRLAGCKTSRLRSPCTRVR